MRPSQTYSLLELGELLVGNENAIAETQYIQRMRKLERDYSDGSITKGAYDIGVKQLQESHWYDEYLYFRDQFKAICHLTFIPEERSMGELGILIVDRKPDGTYSLLGDRTYFNPKFTDCIRSMLHKDRDGYEERVGLAVVGKFDWRNSSCMGSIRDFDNAVYGFRVWKDSLEIFDKYEALQTFGAALKKAYESGKCEEYSFARRVIRI